MVDALTKTASRRPPPPPRRPDRIRPDRHAHDRRRDHNAREQAPALLRQRTTYDYAAQDPINNYDLNGMFCNRCEKIAAKVVGFVASKSVDVAGAFVLGATTIERETVSILRGGSASLAAKVRTLGPTATVFVGGLATAAAQAASDAFQSHLSTGARIGRAAVAGAVGAAAVAAGGAAALACGGCGIVVTVTLNYAGQKYVASYVDRRLGLVPSKP